MGFFRSAAKHERVMTGEEASLLEMIDRTQAVIRFTTEGEVIHANPNFLQVLGYTLEEVRGQHHSIFVDADFRESAAYEDFWERLRAGEFFTSQFERIAKSGQKVFILATYSPIYDNEQRVVGVIKIATDVTERQNGINNIADALDALREGNLTRQVPPCKAADIQKLGDVFNSSVNHLSELVKNVKQVSGNVNITADEIMTTTNDLSRRTETQAATLEETAAAVEELTATARSAAQNAAEVHTISSQTKTAAEGGRHLVSSLTTAMEKIETSSEQISQIISVIEGIAFQTNLLALNAGVEAARAGESGRGFAVVASEVRGLAQRSSESAMEIKSLIQSSSENVSEGSDLVSRATTEFETIFEGVNSISTRVQEIAHGMQEQSETLSEINSSVSQLDQVTQQNAAMVQETSDAGRRLMLGAQDLVSEVEFFTVAGVGTGSGMSLAMAS